MVNLICTVQARDRACFRGEQETSWHTESTEKRCGLLYSISYMLLYWILCSIAINIILFNAKFHTMIPHIDVKQAQESSIMQARALKGTQEE